MPWIHKGIGICRQWIIMCCFLVLKTHKWDYAALKIIKSLHTYMRENDDQSSNSSCGFSPRSGPYPSSSYSSWRVCPRAWPHSVSRGDWGPTKISPGYGSELRPLYRPNYDIMLFVFSCRHKCYLYPYLPESCRASATIHHVDTWCYSRGQTGLLCLKQIRRVMECTHVKECR